jgi:hypothetical protein
MIYECEELLGASENIISWFEWFFGDVCPTCPEDNVRSECKEDCITQDLYKAVAKVKGE